MQPSQVLTGIPAQLRQGQGQGQGALTDCGHLEKPSLLQLEILTSSTACETLTDPWHCLSLGKQLEVCSLGKLAVHNSTMVTLAPWGCTASPWAFGIQKTTAASPPYPPAPRFKACAMQVLRHDHKKDKGDSAQAHSQRIPSASQRQGDSAHTHTSHTIPAAHPAIPSQPTCPRRDKL